MARKTRTDPWADQTLAVEVPRADVPEYKKERRWRWIRNYTWASALLFPLALVAVVVMLSEQNAAVDRALATIEEANNASVMDVEDSQARAASINAVEQWLSTTPSPLPTGKVVSWDGAKTIPDLAEPEPGRTREEMGWPDLEVHTLTLSTAAGTLYRAEVTLELTPAGAVPASTPSLIPYTPTGQSTAGVPWPGATTVQPSEEVRQAAVTWAETFTSGDPAKLRLLVGDEDPNHAYVPLSGVRLDGFQVTTGAVHPTADNLQQGGDPGGANRLMVRVEARLVWRGQPEDTLEGRKVSYDLLVAGANTGSPRVVAWGGPGSGPALEPFANAVDGVDLVASDNSLGGDDA